MNKDIETNAKKGRNSAILFALLGLIVIIFIVTIVKMSGGVK